MLTKLFEQRSQVASRCNIRGAEHKRVRQLLELREPILSRLTVRTRHALRRVLILDGHVPILYFLGNRKFLESRLRNSPLLPS
jgi:hypothetical protein